MKQTAFWREKNAEYRACLKYSLPIFIEWIYKMQRLEVSGAIRPIYGSLGVKRLITGSSDKELTLASVTRHYCHTTIMPSILSGVCFATFLLVKECHVVVCCWVSKYNKQANPLYKQFLYAARVSTGDASFNHSHTTTLNMHAIKNGIIVSMYMHLF